MPTEQTEQPIPSPEQLSAESGTAWVTRNYSWILQELHHVAGDVGKLQEAVGTLKDTVKDQTKALNWIKYVIFIAIGALFVIGYFIDNRFDQIMEALAKK